jgi:hypothetical protein
MVIWIKKYNIFQYEFCKHDDELQKETAWWTLLLKTQILKQAMKVDFIL